jgi:hypothetical protein
MAARRATLDWIRRIKEKHEASLLSKKNVIGVGIGFRERGGQATDQMALIVSVLRKLPTSEVSADDIIPTEIEGVPVDVKEVGEIRALSQ